MKNLLSISLFLMITNFGFSQWTKNLSIHVGGNLSWFTGNGDQEFNGFRYKRPTVDMGLDYSIPMTKTFSINTGLHFIGFGATNPQEDVNFNTYHIHLPITLGVKAGAFTFHAGGYVNRSIYAQNSNFSGEGNFRWSTNDWGYYKKEIVGFKGIVEYDFIGMKGNVSFMEGITTVLKPPYQSAKMRGARDISVAVGLNIPIQTFLE